MPEIDLETLVLQEGRHSRPEVGMSVLEAVSYLSPMEKFGDKPRNVSPVIANHLRVWNDFLDEGTRQQLKPYIPKVMDSILTDDVEEHRSWMCTDWLVRVQAPIWLQAAGLEDLAQALREKDPIWTPDQAREVQTILDEAHERVNYEAKTGADLWNEAGEKAWAEVSPKAWEAVSNGIKNAVRSATSRGSIAAFAAAETGKRYAARDAAFEIACDVAWDAAFTMAWEVALPIGGFTSGEATGAVRETLQPAADQLHTLNFELLDALIAIRRVPEEVTRDVDIVGS